MTTAILVRAQHPGGAPSRIRPLLANPIRERTAP